MKRQELNDSIDEVNNFLLTKNIQFEYNYYDQYDIQKYYEQAREIILDELAENLAIKINDINKKNTPSISARATSMINSMFSVQRALVDLFNQSQANGTFDGTIFEHGIFEVCSQSTELKNPSPLLFMNANMSKPFYNILYIKFTPNLPCLISESSFTANTDMQKQASKFILKQKDEIIAYLNQLHTLSSNERKKLQDFFIQTSVPTLQKSLCNFIDAVEKHHLNFEVCLHTTTPIIYGKSQKSTLIYLLYLYAEILQNEALNESILPKAIPEITCRGKRNNCGILLSPFDDNKGEKNQHNLRLNYNPHIINKKDNKSH